MDSKPAVLRLPCKVLEGSQQRGDLAQEIRSEICLLFWGSKKISGGVRASGRIAFAHTGWVLWLSKATRGHFHLQGADEQMGDLQEQASTQRLCSQCR